MKKLVIALVAVIVIAGAALAVYKIFLEDDAAPELGLTTTSSTEGSNGTTDGDATPASIDGTWQARSEEPTRAGLRIKESFLSGIADHTAVGRTSEVTGSLTIAGTEVTAGSFTVDLASLEFTDDPPGLDVANRARAMENAGLETNTFPSTSFKLTEPIDLAEIPETGQTVTTDATGEFTLHGVTKTITFSVDAQVIEGQIEIATTDPVEIKLADYDITPPVQGPVAKVSDTGSFEFVVRLEKG